VQEATCGFTADAENVRAARRFVSETAEKWDLGDLAWPLTQIVSELASNAVIHAGTDFTVHLTHDSDAMRIEVLDASPRKARARRYDLDATTGRGLRLVENLSREWGVSGDAKGKVVWAVLDGTPLLDIDRESFAESFLELLDESNVGVPPAKKPPAKRRRRATKSRAA
jgi:anti-sigma regulatory factor (Ser/Thr protein kinase)